MCCLFKLAFLFTKNKTYWRKYYYSADGAITTPLNLKQARLKHIGTYCWSKPLDCRPGPVFMQVSHTLVDIVVNVAGVSSRTEKQSEISS